MYDTKELTRLYNHINVYSRDVSIKIVLSLLPISHLKSKVDQY